MKTKIKITIDDHIYEIENDYVSGLETIMNSIEKIIKLEILLSEKK